MPAQALSLPQYRAGIQGHCRSKMRQHGCVSPPRYTRVICMEVRHAPFPRAKLLEESHCVIPAKAGIQRGGDENEAAKRGALRKTPFGKLLNILGSKPQCTIRTRRFFESPHSPTATVARLAIPITLRLSEGRPAPAEITPASA